MIPNRHYLMVVALLASLAACSSPEEPAEGQNQAAAEAAPKRIALIGATARSGRVIIRQALEAGYEVTGLARTPSKLGFEHENLTLVKGDVRDIETLKAALTGDEVVISMVGMPAPTNPNEQIGMVDLYTVMAENLISAMKDKGNKRLIMASSAGVQDRVPNDATAPASDSMSDGWRFNARFLYNDMADMETMIAESGLEYVLLRPGFLVEEPARNDLQVTKDGSSPGQRTLTYEDFAAFALEQVDSGGYLNMAVGMYTDEIMDPAKEVKKYLEKLKKQQEAQKAAGAAQ
jgi:putative NADH-flavin reductase